MKNMNAMKRAKSVAFAVGMSALMLGGSMAGTVMQAGVALAEDFQASKGDVDFGKGNASITINGNIGDSPLRVKPLPYTSCSTQRTLMAVNPSTIHSLENMIRLSKL